MPRPMQRLYAVVGRLTGLAGTVRYDLDDELRGELQEIVEQLEDSLSDLPEEVELLGKTEYPYM